MAPKIVDKEQRQREIALKALDVFAERGFEAASMSQIAAAVGIGKGTIYEYFDSKDELIFASLMAWMEQFSEGIEQLIATVEGPEEQLRTLMRMSLAMLDEDPKMMQLMMAMTQLLLRTNFVSKFHFVRDGFHRLRMDIVNILLAGVSQGVFRPEIAKDAEKIAINLLAYMDGIGMHYYLSNNYFDVMEQVDFYLDQLFVGLRADGGEGR